MLLLHVENPKSRYGGSNPRGSMHAIGCPRMAVIRAVHIFYPHENTDFWAKSYLLCRLFFYCIFGKSNLLQCFWALLHKNRMKISHASESQTYNSNVTHVSLP